MLATLGVVLGVLLVMSFCCSLMEACVLSVSRADVATLEVQSPRIGRIWSRFRDRLQQPLAVILVLNTFTHTIGAALAGSLFGELYGTQWLWAFSLAISFVMIQWTEILPKSLGTRYNRRIAPVIAVPLQLTVDLFRPVTWFISFLNRPFERHTSSRDADAVNDIYAVARAAAMSKQIDPAQVKMIESATGLSRMTVEDFMIPREDVSWLSTEMSLSDALVQAHEDGHTRYPVTRGGSLDDVVGYANFKEIVAAMRVNPEDATLRGICRPIARVSLSESASSLLRILVEQRQHLAVVEDASGRTVGLVALEDILQAPIAEMGGEFERGPSMIQELLSGRWLVGGGALMGELRKRLDKPLPGLPTEGTVSDWIAGVLGRKPKPNETVVNWGLRVTIRRVRRGRVFEAVISEL